MSQTKKLSKKLLRELRARSERRRLLDSQAGIATIAVTIISSVGGTLLSSFLPFRESLFTMMAALDAGRGAWEHRQGGGISSWLFHRENKEQSRHCTALNLQGDGARFTETGQEIQFHA